MDILSGLRAFLAAARYGSFSEAARQLHVVPSVIGKRVAELEHRMQLQLFHRSTRRVVLTDAGQHLLVRASSLVSEFDDVVANMKRQEDVLEGHLRIKVPTTLTTLYLAKILTAFQREYSQISLEVILADRSVNPIDDGFDFVITGLAESYEGVIDFPLCPLEPVICASPGYIESTRRPEHPRDLLDHRCLVFSPRGTSWQFESQHGPITLDIPPTLVTNDNTMLFASVCAGNGIAALPVYLVKPEIESGRLIPLLPEYPLRPSWLKILVPKRHQQRPQITALIAWIRKHLEDTQPWNA